MTFVTNISYPPQVSEQSLFLFNCAREKNIISVGLEEYFFTHPM